MGTAAANVEWEGQRSKKHGQNKRFKELKSVNISELFSWKRYRIVSLLGLPVMLCETVGLCLT